MTEQEKWIDKIQKLIRKAESASGPESETFFAKAQELMTLWAIDEAMLSVQGKSDDKIVTEHFTMKRSGLFNAMVEMAVEVADANGVRCLLYSPERFKTYAGVDFIGWKSDVDKVKMLYTSLWLQCAREQNREMPDDIKKSSGAGKWRRSYRSAYARRIGERLREVKRVTEQEAIKTSGSSNGMELAIIDRGKQVQLYMDSLNTKPARQRRTQTDWEAAASGRSAANRADLGQTRVGGNRGELNK